MWNSRKKQSRCGCIRHRPGKPKLASSLCHGSGGYHPSVIERIAGRRLCASWRLALRALAPDDVEL